MGDLREIITMTKGMKRFHHYGCITAMLATFLISSTALTAEESDAGGQDASAANSVTREGLQINFSVAPAKSSHQARAADAAEETAPLMAGDLATFRFEIKDASTQQGISGIYPGSWVDLHKPWKGEPAVTLECKDRVGMYLKKLVGVRPMIDLNSYYVVVLNDDSTISVIDPLIGVTGITKLYAQIVLKRPGGDWTKNGAENRIFVSLPTEDEVAVIDAINFKLIGYVPAGDKPLRIALQPDEKYLWIGNDSLREADSGVTVIDAETYEIKAQIATGAGHHELAFSDDSRYAFVTNRNSGTLTVIDIQTLQKVQEIAVGKTPISLAYSALADAVFVADAASGAIKVIDAKKPAVRAQLQARPGLGPMRLSKDGRWGFVVNPGADRVHVFDTAGSELLPDIEVEGQPYQIAVSRAFAYVRTLKSERVSMINLNELSKGNRTPPVVTFAAGDNAPSKVPQLSIADSIVESVGEAAVFVTSPGDATVYFYMEGMNAPMGNFRNYGHRPAAVMVTDRTLKEEKPGVYTASVRVPEAGEYDVAFLIDTPQVLHCFTFTAEPSAHDLAKQEEMVVTYLEPRRVVTAHEPTDFRFRLSLGAEKPVEDLQDVSVLYYRAPGLGRNEIAATHIGDGVYQVSLPPMQKGAYYLYVQTPSMKVRYGDLHYTTFRVLEAQEQAASTPALAKGD